MEAIPPKISQIKLIKIKKNRALELQLNITPLAPYPRFPSKQAHRSTIFVNQY